VICQSDQLPDAALKGVEPKNVGVNCDKTETRSEVVLPDESAISPTNITQEEERIPRVIVTTSFPGAIAISSSPQAQKVREQGGSGLGVIEQEAITPTKITQKESEPVPRVIVPAYAKGAIATSSVPQEQISEPQPPKDIFPPVPSPVKLQPVAPKNLTQAELDALENELKRLRINPDSCIFVVKKYWDNVQGAIARVKEALQQGWCCNPTGLFINSCKKSIKPQKSQVSNDVSE